MTGEKPQITDRVVAWAAVCVAVPAILVWWIESQLVGAQMVASVEPVAFEAWAPAYTTAVWVLILLIAIPLFFVTVPYVSGKDDETDGGPDA